MERLKRFGHETKDFGDINLEYVYEDPDDDGIKNPKNVAQCALKVKYIISKNSVTCNRLTRTGCKLLMQLKGLSQTIFAYVKRSNDEVI